MRVARTRSVDLRACCRLRPRQLAHPRRAASVRRADAAEASSPPRAGARGRRHATSTPHRRRRATPRAAPQRLPRRRRRRAQRVAAGTAPTGRRAPPAPRTAATVLDAAEAGAAPAAIDARAREERARAVRGGARAGREAPFCSASARVESRRDLVRPASSPSELRRSSSARSDVPSDGRRRGLCARGAPHAAPKLARARPPWAAILAASTEETAWRGRIRRAREAREIGRRPIARGQAASSARGAARSSRACGSDVSAWTSSAPIG